MFNIAEAPSPAAADKAGPALNVFVCGSYIFVVVVKFPRTTRNFPSGRFSANPPIAVFSPARSGRTGHTKHTFDNIKEVLGGYMSNAKTGDKLVIEVVPLFTNKLSVALLSQLLLFIKPVLV